MSTEEERAALLRVIAANGYSVWEDQDGSTAARLEEIADALAPMSPPPPHRKHGFLYTFTRHVKRVYLRLKLRAKLRWLGLVPVVAVLWATVEVRALAAQAPGDSLIMTKLVRDAIGEWQDGTYKAYCLTWVAEKPERPRILFLLDAVPADTSQTPLCGSPEGAYPVFLDAPTCPPEERVAVTDRSFVLIRCGADSFARYRRAFGTKRT
jgi:hypothetical protein